MLAVWPIADRVCEVCALKSIQALSDCLYTRYDIGRYVALDKALDAAAAAAAAAGKCYSITDLRQLSVAYWLTRCLKLRYFLNFWRALL